MNNIQRLKSSVKRISEEEQEFEKEVERSIAQKFEKATNVIVAELTEEFKDRITDSLNILNLSYDEAVIVEENIRARIKENL